MIARSIGSLYSLKIFAINAYRKPKLMQYSEPKKGIVFFKKIHTIERAKTRTDEAKPPIISAVFAEISSSIYIVE